MQVAFILVSLMLAAIATGAPSQPMDKYRDSLIKMNQVRNLVLGSLDEVVRAALADNAAVGEQIQVIAVQRGIAADEIFLFLHNELLAQRLSLEQAVTSLTELNQILDGGKAEMFPFVEQLSQNVQAHIVNVFTVTYEQVARIVEEIFALLSEDKIKSTF